MNFASVRIITADIERLTHFYAEVAGQPFDMIVPDFGELRIAGATLAIASMKTLAVYGDAIAEPAANRSAILEFQVDDVDAEYGRLADTIGDGLVQAPTTMPWGNRSLLFRDPDGNLVNLFAPVAAREGSVSS